jgi:hypothetical protein
MRMFAQIPQQIPKGGKALRAEILLIRGHEPIVLKNLSINMNRVNGLVGIVSAVERQNPLKAKSCPKITGMDIHNLQEQPN